MLRKFILFLPEKAQPIFVIVTTLCLAFVSASFCGFFFDEHQLVTNTDLTSSVYETMGTIYAILLTFTLWGVWQNFTVAENSVQNEAYALLDLVHMLETTSPQNSADVRTAALAYSTAVIQHEWPTLKNLTNASIHLLEHNQSAVMQVIQSVQHLTPKSASETVLFDKALTLLTRWLDARRTRLLIARGDSAKALWPLLLVGAFVLFAFHGLFVAKTIAIWITLLFGTSLVIGVTFFLIFSLDCPFAGSLSIDPEPFTLTIDFLKMHPEV